MAVTERYLKTEEPDMIPQMTVEQWVALFREIGLDDAAMHRWHDLFEARHPEAHRSFLQWLGLAPEDVERIRQRHRA